jgi:hypothetical protein
MSLDHKPLAHQNLLMQFLIGRFFFQNYRDAVDRIRHGATELSELLTITETTPEMLEKYLEDEREYLGKVTKELEEDEISVPAEYADLLQNLAVAKCVQLG